MSRSCGTDLYETFVTVVEAGSFTAAAEHLHCSQTAVSQRVRRFEELLERRLFRRSTRMLELTPAGEAFLPFARNLLKMHREGIGVARNAQAEGLRFGVPDRYANAVIPAFVETAKRATGVAPLVRCNRSPVLYDMFRQNQLDVLVMTRCQTLEHGRLLAKEQMVWAGHPEFRWPAEEPIPLAAAPEDCPYRNLALTALQQAKVPWNVVHTGENGWALEEGVRQQHAVMVIPELRIGPELVDVGTALGLPEIGHAELELHLSDLTVGLYGSEFEEVLIDRMASALAET